MNTISVGIISSNPVLSSQLQRFINQADGFKVDTSCVMSLNGRGASHAFDANACEVIVFVLRIPTADDLETLRILRQKQPHLYIIAVSTLEARDYQKIVLAAGADRFLLDRNLVTDLIPMLNAVNQGCEEDQR